MKRKPLLTADGKKPSASAIRKHLFSTLHEETNPITHSDAYARAGSSSPSYTTSLPPSLPLEVPYQIPHIVFTIVLIIFIDSPFF